MMSHQQITFEKHWEDKDFTDFGAFSPEMSQRIIRIFHIEEPMSTPTIPIPQPPLTGSLPTPSPLAASIIHDLVLTGLTAASIFVKNPQSQAQAGALISLVNAILKEHGASL